MPTCCFCSPNLIYVTEQTYASSMGSPKPSFIPVIHQKTHLKLTEDWLLTHDSVVSFRRVFVLHTIIVCCDIDILLIHSNTKSVFLDDRGGSSYKIDRGLIGPPGYQVQLLGILMD